MEGVGRSFGSSRECVSWKESVAAKERGEGVYIPEPPKLAVVVLVM